MHRVWGWQTIAVSKARWQLRRRVDAVPHVPFATILENLKYELGYGSIGELYRPARAA